MALRVLIVDDEPLARSRLTGLLAECSAPGALLAGAAADAAEALHCLAHQAVDVVLLDIHMPGVNGLALAHSLRALPVPPVVVFVTAHSEHALQAFELEALDYLTKPVRLERLQASLQKIERLTQSAKGSELDLSEEVLVIQERGRTERVPVSEVLYVKAELKYLTVRTASHSYLLEGSLNDLEGRYPSRFIRIHRNALVARQAVRSLQKHHDPEEGESWALRLDRVDEALLVSRRQLAAVRALVALR